MADEAFALSPISARAAQPREEDYEAISEAFMETSRGRWFLGEYAKRNRNADTRMVLDAVARIEENLAAQKQPDARNTGSPRRWPRSRRAVDEARAAASARARRSRAGGKSGAGPQGRPGDPGDRLAAARDRRRRPDLRSDRFASQRHRSGLRADSPRSMPTAAFSAAFDLIEQRIGEFGDGDPAAPQADRCKPIACSPGPPDRMQPPARAVRHAAAGTAPSQPRDDGRGAGSMVAADIEVAASLT